MLRKSLLYIFFVLLTGCANLSPIAITLTDLGTASKSEHSMKGLLVMRTVNVTGLGPNEVIGSLSVDPDPSHLDFSNIMSTADYPDSLSFRLSPECSRIVESNFGGKIEVTIEDVATVRDNIQELVELISKKIGLEIKQIVLMKSTDSLADTTKDHQEILRILQTQYPGDKLSEVSEVSDTLKNVNGQLEAVQKVIESKRETLRAALTKSGIVVTRWSQERKKKSTIDALKGFMVQASSNSLQEGFLVLGNPRVTSLVLGDDFLEEDEVLECKNDCIKMKTPFQAKRTYVPGEDFLEEEQALECKKDCIKMKTLFQAKRTYVTYYQLSAKQIAWGEVRAGTSSKNIQADISQIASTLQPYLKAANFAAVLKDLQIKADLEMSRAYDYGNSGLLSGGKTRVFPMRFSNTHNYIAALTAEHKRAEGYIPIYNARGTLGEVVAKRLDNTKSARKFKFGAQCSKSELFSYFEKDQLGENH